MKQFLLKFYVSLSSLNSGEFFFFLGGGGRGHMGNSSFDVK